MPQQYPRNAAAAKINFKHHVGTFYQNLKVAAHPAFLHQVASDSMAFDHYDIVYKAPLALFKSMIPLFVGGAKAVYKNHQRKQKIKAHAAWKQTLNKPMP